MKAVAPSAMPSTPDDYTGWRRSLRRGSTFHLHRHGWLACNPMRTVDRNASEAAADLGAFQYWGACPRCLAISFQ